MRRRKFITLLGGAAAAWPLVARAQQPAMPVVGYLDTGSPEANTKTAAAFRKGLGDTGFVEGRNVTIEYRWGHNDPARMPELVDDLVRRRVSVIAAVNGIQAILAAKAATTTIPIVFRTAGDPVQSGFVPSLNRPGGNITGITSMSGELGPKRLGLLHDLIPRAQRFGALTSPTSSSVSAPTELHAAAAAIGRPLDIFTASTNRDIDSAFASMVQKRVDALVVVNSILLVNRSVQLVTLAAHHRLPVIYYNRDFVEIGGLMSYGASVTYHFGQAGIYVGRVLKGEKPADLPVVRPTKFEFVINLQTARTLGIDIPPGVLPIADEVIE